MAESLLIIDDWVKIMLTDESRSRAVFPSDQDRRTQVTKEIKIV